MYVTFTTGVLLWGIYGIIKQDWAIILANAVTAMLSMAILITKLRYDVLPARSDS